MVVGFAAFASAAIGPAVAFERLTARPRRVRFDSSGLSIAFGTAVLFVTFAASR
jgi:hypothetical protein